MGYVRERFGRDAKRAAAKLDAFVNDAVLELLVRRGPSAQRQFAAQSGSRKSLE